MSRRPTLSLGRRATLSIARRITQSLQRGVLPAGPRPARDNERVRRHYSPRWGRQVVTIGPGALHLAQGDELIETLLGSCVAACVRDPLVRGGGMNHVMLPVEGRSSGGTRLAATAYGSYAMEVLLNAIYQAGGRRERLEVKLFGGGRMLAGMTDIGLRNIEFLRDYLRVEGLRLVSEDVGGTTPRKVLYQPASGKAKLRRLRSPIEEVASRELEELDQTAGPTPEPELF